MSKPNDMDALYYKVSIQTSRLVTHAYSTSFSIGARFLHASVRDAIYSIYGFVRFADEIVDSFAGYDKERLLEDFEREYDKALVYGISMNPVLNAFQSTVTRYRIPDELIRAFLKSMRQDLYKVKFGEEELKAYIYGSAEVVGLMCLSVFVDGDRRAYDKLKPFAMRLGDAFQKVNFLRDLRHDTQYLHRIYFPVLKREPLNETNKRDLLNEIKEDFRMGLEGIRQLPASARLGVYTAYLYYKSLAKLIETTPADQLIQKRIRVPNTTKVWLFGKAYLTTKFSFLW